MCNYFDNIHVEKDAESPLKNLNVGCVTTL